MAIAVITFFYGGVAKKKRATITVTVAFFYGGVVMRRQR